jgi:putative Mg2+ transporter-C (MgtC) family protein
MGQLFVDLSWPDLVRDVIRLTIAAALGGTIGFERQLHKQYAGLRTHALVALGSAGFMLLSLDLAGDASAAMRGVQGIIIGIGFLGSGNILKQRRRVRGLTTAGAIWNAAAIGAAIGAGFLLIGLVLTGATLVVLWVLRTLEHRTRLKSPLGLQTRKPAPSPPRAPSPTAQ